jgi:hypothetical protein
LLSEGITEPSPETVVCGLRSLIEWSCKPAAVNISAAAGWTVVCGYMHRHDALRWRQLGGATVAL